MSRGAVDDYDLQRDGICFIEYTFSNTAIN